MYQQVRSTNSQIALSALAVVRDIAKDFDKLLLVDSTLPKQVLRVYYGFIRTLYPLRLFSSSLYGNYFTHTTPILTIAINMLFLCNRNQDVIPYNSTSRCYYPQHITHHLLLSFPPLISASHQIIESLLASLNTHMEAQKAPPPEDTCTERYSIKSSPNTIYDPFGGDPLPTNVNFVLPKLAAPGKESNIKSYQVKLLELSWIKSIYLDRLQSFYCIIVLDIS